MIYVVLFWEFFKVGLLAIGGGLVTVPFLYDLAEKYNWFNAGELANMIAVSESTPGPLGVNMSTYAGFKAADICGGLAATLGLITPSVIIIILLARYMQNHPQNLKLEVILKSIRPAVLALICMAGLVIAQTSVANYTQLAAVILAFALIHKFKKSPILYIILGAVGGLLLA